METDLAWAAGLFDGEGCVSIGYIPAGHGKNTRNSSYRLTVKLTMGCKVTVARFGKVIGAGTFHRHQPHSERTNASYSWVGMARNGHDILKMIRPYLITKAAEADVAIAFCELPDGRTGGKGGSLPMCRKLLQRRHDLYLKCCKLKSRWRFRKTKPGARPAPTITK